MNVELTKKEQLIGLLTGEWSPEAKAAFGAGLYREVLTVKRADILDFLQERSDLAQAYLKKWEELRPAVDINVMWEEKGVYKVAWMSWNGQPSLVREYTELNPAVAEHACRQNGIGE